MESKKSTSFILFSFFLLFIFLSFALSCSPLHYVTTETKYNIVDSTVVNTVDSVVIIPKEVIRDVVPIYDTLTMENSVAKSTSYVDTLTHTLKGELKSKKDIQYKYIYKDRIQVKDSIVTKEIPVPVEVIKYKHYKYEKYLWIVAIGLIVALIVKFVLPILKKYFMKV